MQTALAEGDLAFRQHQFGHTPAPNWPVFLDLQGGICTHRGGQHGINKWGARAVRALSVVAPEKSTNSLW